MLLVEDTGRGQLMTAARRCKLMQDQRSIHTASSGKGVDLWIAGMLGLLDAHLTSLTE